MRRFPGKALIPVMMAAIVLSFPAVSQAQFYWNWGWGWTPSYSTYYAPTTVTASFAPASCNPCCDPCDPCCPSGACGLQRARFAPSSACCDPCDPCCTTCCRPCCPDECDLGSSSSSSGGQDRGTTVQPRSDSAGSGGRTPTFVEEEDRGGSGSNYEQDQGGTGDGFQPRNSSDGDTEPPDPLDQNFGTSTAGGPEELRFKIPAKQPENRKNPTRRVNKHRQPDYPVLKLDEKITSRSQPRRTRLIERRSWQQPVVAKNVRRESRDGNRGWVPVPLPATQLVKK